jgi:hypothetical protein
MEAPDIQVLHGFIGYVGMLVALCAYNCSIISFLAKNSKTIECKLNGVKDSGMYDIIIISIIGPINEEAIFRHGLPRLMMGIQYGDFINCVLFAMSHIVNYRIVRSKLLIANQLMTTFILGCILISMDNCIYSFIFHMVYNFVCYLSMMRILKKMDDNPAKDDEKKFVATRARSSSEDNIRNPVTGCKDVLISDRDLLEKIRKLDKFNYDHYELLNVTVHKDL